MYVIGRTVNKFRLCEKQPITLKGIMLVLKDKINFSACTWSVMDVLRQSGLKMEMTL